MIEITANVLGLFALSGFVFGGLVGLRMPALNQWKLTPREQAGLGLFFGRIYLCLGFLFGLGAVLIGISLHLLFGLSAKVVTQAYFVFCALFVSYFIVKGRGPGAVVDPSLQEKTTRESQAAARQPQGEKVPAYDTKTKVLFLGVDAADWRMIDPLIEQGKLPHLARLKKNGFHAYVDTITPTSSPRIWTSIATSKEPKEHGITDWQKTVFPGFKPLTGEPSSLRYPRDCGAPKIIKWLLKKDIVRAAPSTSQSRKCKAFWNVLSDFGKSSATVGWLFSWPAEKVKGLSVSWYTYPFEEAANVLQRHSSAGLRSRTYPEDFIDKVKDLVVSQKDLKEEELKALNIPTIKIDYDTVRFADQINPWYLSKDKTFSNIAGFILDNYPGLDVVSVFLSGIDATSHTYWTFLNQDKKFDRLRDQLLSMSDDPEFKEQAKGFDKCIELYYRYIDGLVGRFLEKIGENRIVFIASDHGFRYDGTGHGQGCRGAAILYGKNIKRTEERGRISVYDIAPTLLALAGIPIARDLKGRVIKEGIHDDFFKDFPLRSVDTYEGAVSREEETVETPKEVEQGLTRRLRALGYID